ncbi:MAG: undecaprenyldiphospho-muramoylpentapeptide beta-N-acetylglucosaminyltransferase [Gammaproteobacteria bacterium]|nr:undecaprenyldiphospho-muramoylpentapeptide beta-N-acetylglucosaminyltransferase [Gammaproteobacteria bacterium]
MSKKQIDKHSKVKILIMAGGTGGHVFPALAVAEELRSSGVSVVWLGTRRGLESNIVPKAGFPISYISINGLRGKNTLTLLLAPFKLLLALIQSFYVLLSLKPNAVLGMGGFVTGPAGVVAWVLRIPLIIHEQNAIAGMTNRLLSKIASQIFQAFPGVFDDGSNVITVGNPVRTDIGNLHTPEERYNSRNGSLRLLVLGGSLGAVALNETVPPALGLISEKFRPIVFHQTGRDKQEDTEKFYKYAHVQAKIVQFISNMSEAYQWADIVICRAGALTVAELEAAGVASILVPYPHAVDDHQTANAKSLTDAGAGLLIQQDKLTPRYLSDVLSSFAKEDMTEVRERLLNMAQAAYKLATPDAAHEVAMWCKKAATSANDHVAQGPK